MIRLRRVGLRAFDRRILSIPTRSLVAFRVSVARTLCPVRFEGMLSNRWTRSELVRTPNRTSTPSQLVMDLGSMVFDQGMMSATRLDVALRWCSSAWTQLDGARNRLNHEDLRHVCPWPTTLGLTSKQISGPDRAADRLVCRDHGCFEHRMGRSATTLAPPSASISACIPWSECDFAQPPTRRGRRTAWLASVSRRENFGRKNLSDAGGQLLISLSFSTCPPRRFYK